MTSIKIKITEFPRIKTHVAESLERVNKKYTIYFFCISSNNVQLSPDLFLFSLRCFHCLYTIFRCPTWIKMTRQLQNKDDGYNNNQIVETY